MSLVKSSAKVIVVHSHISFQHYLKLISSCMSKLCQIHHVKNSFDQKTLLLIISALVIIKLLHYSTTVWANTRAPKIVKKLQAIQNFVCKIVTNTSQPYVNLTWLALKKQLEYRDTVMTYKCLITSRPPV